MTIEENLKNAIKQLKENNIEDATLKARLLLCNIMKVSKEYLVINSNKELDNIKQKEYLKKLQYLKKHIPLEYITNKKEFMKINFYVDENVLIPRPDTEVIVEEVINYCNNEKNGKAKILDLCTGSGIIAISLAKYLPNCEIIATDISNKALEVAKKNQLNNKVSNIRWIHSNLFSKIYEKFDIIVSNPPYIKKDVINELEEEVKKEPIIALDGGEDGLKFYKEILENAKNYLNKNGAIFLEIGYDQKKEVIDIVKKYYGNVKIECKKDLQNKDRMIRC